MVVFVAYMVLVFLFRGLGALLRGEFAEAVRYLILPVLVFVLSMAFISTGVLASYLDEKHEQDLIREAEWSMANPSDAFTVIKTGQNEWSVTNNTNQIVSGRSSNEDCTAAPQNPPLNTNGAYEPIPSFGPHQTAHIKCDLTTRHKIIFWSQEVTWQK